MLKISACRATTACSATLPVFRLTGVPLAAALHAIDPAAAAVVEQMSAEMVAVGRELLQGMQEPMLILSLALCASKR